MAWFTTKKGKHINTDWFIKDEQLKKNKEIADKLNATGHPVTPVGGKRVKAKHESEAVQRSTPEWTETKQKEIGKNLKDIRERDKKPTPEATAQRFSNTLSKKGISNEWEIQNYIRNLTSARRNTMCRELGITGSVDDKIKTLSHQIYLAGKGNGSGVSTNNSMKFNDKQEVFKQAKDGWTFAKTSSGDLWVGFENDLNKQYYKDTPENRKMLSGLWENQNFSKEIKSTSKTIENKYGFEIENDNSPALEFTDDFWQEMAELRKKDRHLFSDSEMASKVDSKISEIVNEYGDLWYYNPDVCTLREELEDERVTDDEFWAGYHLLAKWLGIKKQASKNIDAGLLPKFSKTVRNAISFLEKDYTGNYHIVVNSDKYGEASFHGTSLASIKWEIAQFLKDGSRF